MESGIASCTGLSIMLTNACRSVGVPARLAGIPNWPNKSGNHTWVEVWDDGAWHFLGAGEPDKRGLNHAWFVGAAAGAQRNHAEHAIYAISYRPTGLDFPMRFDPEAPPVSAVNVTDRYAKPDPEGQTRLLVKVVDERGTRLAAGVTVRDPVDATATFTGVSRDERFDMNDVLPFALERGRRYEVEIVHEGVTGHAEVTANGREQIVSFTLQRCVTATTTTTIAE